MDEAAAGTIRVLLIDDHGTMLWGLTQLINSASPKMAVVAAVNSRDEALEAVRRERPDVILLDLDLGEADGVDLLPTLLKESQARVLICTGVRDTEAHDRAVLRGARGIVHKEAPAEILLDAIEKVHRGELWLDRLATGRVFEKLLEADTAERRHPEPDRSAALTGREREIITAVVELGQSTNKKIAAHLNMSEFTLRNHLTTIYDKLGVENRLDLFKYALRHGLARPSDTDRARK
jgi:two-component system, NarL family, nitrate/nitrite response regulator NarL